MPFRFDESLQKVDYALPPESQETTDELITWIEPEITQLVDLSEQTPGLFPDILNGTTEKQRADHPE